ncbi:MAG TPA: flagellar assembly peptidoglycan hydrolase FlgJ [Gammaproteobacteria bacterium]|nr:flagellar assembly peptidoglycan hydrolase FlgJ [Gammaproteobacteria bacterium]
MTSSLSSASLYTDLQSLEGVRHRADSNPEETLRFAAQQFEALFLQMMLKSARDAKLDDGLFDSEQTDFYQDLHDKQMAINLAQGQGIGIAELLVQQLRSDQGLGKGMENTSAQAAAVDRIRTLRDYLDARLPSASHVAVESPMMASGPVVQKTVLATAEDFVKTLWPQARQAADKLGVDPAVLLAQAALETGWGRFVSRHEDGRSSYNLFNIKADARWGGERISVDTQEFRNGAFARERAQFRAYDSFADSFDDYVNFLQNSTRYRPALDSATDSHRFVSELARAGYATDPDYAEKIIGIIDGEPMARSLSAVSAGRDAD